MDGYNHNIIITIIVGLPSSPCAARRDSFTRASHRLPDEVGTNGVFTEGPQILYIM